MPKKRICVIIGSRANYSSVKSAMHAIAEHKNLELQVVLGASAILDRYGGVSRLIEKDGFKAAAKIHMLIEGETPATMAKSTGLGLLELPTIFEQLQPDIVLTVGDRFETMATTLAAAYMNIPIAHTMGGEVSGTIDESIRHAVTKFAHIHFPASPDARTRIIRLGEPEDTVHLVGCPRIDLVAEVISKDGDILDRHLFDAGVGAELDLEKPFILISQHPVTTEYGDGEHQITETLGAAREVGVPAIVLWPNADAGSEDVARGIRKWREQGLAKDMHFFRNLPVETYIRLMNRTACLVGNSSSGIREGAFLGTPTVNIGSRQNGRERGRNVIDVPPQKELIVSGIKKQLDSGRQSRDTIYGDGHAGRRIADVLANLGTISVQKRISF